MTGKCTVKLGWKVEGFEIEFKDAVIDVNTLRGRGGGWDDLLP